MIGEEMEISRCNLDGGKQRSFPFQPYRGRVEKKHDEGEHSLQRDEWFDSFAQNEILLRLGRGGQRKAGGQEHL